MNRWVEIAFDCLPLRSVARLNAPIEADDARFAKANRIKAAIKKHGTHNNYYLHNAECVFHFTNDASKGMVAFDLEGLITTDEKDLSANTAELQVTLRREDCSWLNQSVVEWLAETVQHAVLIEFNSYIAAGDLQRTAERLAALERDVESTHGFVGMYL